MSGRHLARIRVMEAEAAEKDKRIAELEADSADGAVELERVLGASETVVAELHARLAAGMAGYTELQEKYDTLVGETADEASGD